MTQSLEDELARAHAIVGRQHEIVTCWRTLYHPGELRFTLLPDDMWSIITASPDYRELVAGGPPTLLNIAGENEAVELMTYRAEADGRVYMLAPERG
ncbi:hypothetical protein [Sphingomonas hankookensis]|uniref:hypothetical protein n=1 Tax=Sphingomonas hankookensis TaxID=563996 RepID=UPI0037042D76